LTQKNCVSKNQIKGFDVKLVLFYKTGVIGLIQFLSQYALHYTAMSVHCAAHWYRNGQYPDTDHKGFLFVFIFSCKKYPQTSRYELVFDMHNLFANKNIFQQSSENRDKTF